VRQYGTHVGEAPKIMAGQHLGRSVAGLAPADRARGRAPDIVPAAEPVDGPTAAEDQSEHLSRTLSARCVGLLDKALPYSRDAEPWSDRSRI